MFSTRTVQFCVIAIFLSSCGGSSGGNSVLDTSLRSLITQHALTGDPSLGRTVPSITDSTAQLGMKLFFAKSLGGDFDSACVTCHHPVLGGGDELPLSIGVGARRVDALGVGRSHPDGDFTVPRNAPTTFNLALWDSTLFWDGRVESLGKTAGANGDDGLGIRTPDSSFGVADSSSGSNISTAQARFPVTSKEEMRGFTFVQGGSNAALRSALEDRLTTDGSWDAEFLAAFGSSEITYPRIAEALAEYERSQVFVETPWKAYVEGDNNAITAAAKRGALLFFATEDEGGFDCASCHSGDFFTDEKYWGLAVPQIGRGKGDGDTGTNDFGRFRETKDANEKFTFRTAALLNVEVTGPYMHDGAFSTLEAAIKHHIDPVGSIASYDTAQAGVADLSDWVENTNVLVAYLKESSDRGISTLTDPKSIGADQLSDIVEFLKALTDPCVKSRECLSSWIPSELEDVDGTQVKATDSTGNKL